MIWRHCFWIVPHRSINIDGRAHTSRHDSILIIMFRVPHRSCNYSNVPSDGCDSLLLFLYIFYYSVHDRNHIKTINNTISYPVSSKPSASFALQSHYHHIIGYGLMACRLTLVFYFFIFFVSNVDDRPRWVWLTLLHHLRSIHASSYGRVYRLPFEPVLYDDYLFFLLFVVVVVFGFVLSFFMPSQFLTSTLHPISFQSPLRMFTNRKSRSIPI